MRHPFSFFRHHSAFTLIELLIVIAVIAILSVVVILVLNPSQLLMQSRDTNRISDMASLNSALGIYAAQGGSFLGSSSVVYISVPDPVATSSSGDQCQGLGLPAAPSGTTYFCGASSTYRNPNGSGWVPVNFTNLAGGSPLGELPIDPINQTSSNFYYSYATNGTQFIVTAIPESQKYKAQYTSNPSIPDYPEVIAQGTNLTISPLFSPTGLIAYWNFDEGSGSSTLDVSGNGNTGTWENGPSNQEYRGGKVGPYSGFFSYFGGYGYNYISLPSFSFNQQPFTVMGWVYSKRTTNPGGISLEQRTSGRG